jgi:hypothetical protein
VATYSRIAFVALAFASLPPAAHSSERSWDGTWTGVMGRLPTVKSPVAVTIAKDKVVSYTVRGAPFDIQYSSVTPASVSFGDREHYFVTINRTGDTTASAIAHGRKGFGTSSLTRQ